MVRIPTRNLLFLLLYRITATVCLVGSVPSLSMGAEEMMRAGTGKVCITPEKSIWMAGYIIRNKPSEGKIQDLHVKALAFLDQTRALSVLVTADLLGFPQRLSQRIAQRVQEELGIPRERLMLTSSHTHSGPVLSESLEDMYEMPEDQAKWVMEYTDGIPSKVLESIHAAVSDLEPCTLAWGIGSASFGKNRREYTLDGLTNGFNPIGPVDHDVPVLKVSRMDGSLKAVAMGYACHNTTLQHYVLNGDYAGFAQADLETAFPGCTALFTMGCGGDINPLPRGEFEQAREYGKQLAEAVRKVLDGSMTEVKGPITACYKEIPLALATPPTREELRQQADSSEYVIKRRAQRLLGILDSRGALETTYPYPMQVWKFSDTLSIIALAGESVVDYSLRLKYDFGRERLWVISYAIDVFAYIPSLRVLREGGYEGRDAMLYYGMYGPWAPTVERDILSTAHEMMGR